MLIPYSLPLDRSGHQAASHPWDDPVRALYPHHREFWPADIPEHVLLQQRSLRLARKRRRLKVLKILRWFFWRMPAWTGGGIRPRLHSKARPDAVSLPLAAGGCRADCQ
ncbi:hypothetical protein [Roseibium sp. M-1]